MEFNTNDYYFIIGLIRDKHHVSFELENKVVHEFREGPIPLFKLIFIEKLDDGGSTMGVSFHLDLDAVDVVQWFLRIRDIFNPLVLTPSYYKDDNNETFVGATAEQLRVFKIQQAALTEWGGDKESAKKMIDAKAVGRKRDPRRDRGFINKDEAEEEFFRMGLNKEKDKIQ